MAYTVKQVGAISGVSVRTLHFYDETGLLKPAYIGANGYRFYEEAQLLMLQQILFYRELRFELKNIKRIIERGDFEKVTALKSHRKILEKSLTHTHRLLKTIDKTMAHLKGTRRMKKKEMFAGFSVAAGDDRFGKRIKLGSDTNDCKVSGKDTGGALCVFEFTGGGGPRHSHYEQDEWIYVIEGDYEFFIGEKHLQVSAGESVFIPRGVAHVWAARKPGRIINVYQPAGKMEEFFRKVSRFKDLPTLKQVKNRDFTEKQVKDLHRLFEAHGMDLLGPPHVV
jgi:DNA-binding transcriptional MerR regulator